MEYLNNSKIVAGLAMLMLNLGSRYVQSDLSKSHEVVLSNEYVKKVIVFSLFFVATRDLKIAFLLTIFYILIVDVILHDRRKFCLVPKKYTTRNYTTEEYEKAKNIIKEYESVPATESSLYNNYLNRISNIS
jgi:hypothetical protein